VVQVAGQLGAEKTAGDRREARGGLGGGGKQWEGRHGGALVLVIRRAGVRSDGAACGPEEEQQACVMEASGVQN